MKASAVHRALAAINDLEEGDKALPEQVAKDAAALKECLHKYASGGYNEPSEGDMAAKKAAGRKDEDGDTPDFESAKDKARERFRKSSKQDAEADSDESY